MVDVREVRTVSFGIDGGFITNISREWFWLEKPYSKSEELLLSIITNGTGIDESYAKDIARSIISGKKKLVRVNAFTLEDDDFYIKEYRNSGSIGIS